MSRRGWIEVLRAGTALGLLVALSAQANAGGFAVKEQSTYGQGSSFAGIAAGGSLSSMFWNPATMTQFGGIQTEASVSGIIPYAAHHPLSGSTLIPLGFGGTSDTGKDALVPSAYASWQIKPDLWLGLSVNSPFGLSVGFPNVWAGRDYAANDSSLKTYNATPSIAYRFNDLISVGAGVQIQYAKATLNQGITAPPNLLIKNLDGNGWGYGFTAGVTLTPTPTTSIGVGYRSAINQKIDAIASASLVVPPTPVSTTVRLPDTVSVGLRQRVRPATDFAWDSRMDELEPDRYVERSALQRSVARQRCPSSSKMAGSSRRARNINGLTALRYAAVSHGRNPRSPIRCACHCCRIMTGLGCPWARATTSRRISLPISHIHTCGCVIRRSIYLRHPAIRGSILLSQLRMSGT